MKENRVIWDNVFVTDPKVVKPITGKSYKGSSVNPYWMIERATDIFGPCGIGWGVRVLSERFERFFEDEALHIAIVQVWYIYEGKRGEIEQAGQTRAAYKSNNGRFIVDEDAPKKSVTDGMTKCLSMLGFAGDIFSGRWDDSKYVEWAGEETARREDKEAYEGAKASILNSKTVEEIGVRLRAAAAAYPKKKAELQALATSRKKQLTQQESGGEQQSGGENGNGA